MIRRELSPAFMGSVLLHAGVAAALLVSWNFTRDLKVGAVVPVTIVSNAPATDLAPALEAPEPQTAAADEPVPMAQLDPAPPAPQPTPQPPAPAASPPKAAPTPPKPVPPVKTATPTPAPKKAAPPAKPQDSDSFFKSLEASLSKTTKTAGGRPSPAPKGPSRAETAPIARPNLGSGDAAAALSGLTEELQRRWNPNCAVEGGRDVVVRVSFQIGAGGGIVGAVTPQIRGAQNAVSQAAAERAVRAVYAASPFRNLPRDFYGQRVAVNFNAREACS